MHQTNLQILQFLEEDLEKTGAWTFHYVIEEALGLSPMVVDISITQLEQEKMITRCLCGCNGIMIAPAGYDVLPKPEKKELAKAIALSPELADVLEQALPYLREAAKADGHANGTYQLASKLLKKWSQYNV